MGRPQKKGLDWFPHDTDMSRDPKVETVFTMLGFPGHSVFIQLLEMIYREGGELDMSNGIISEGSIIKRLGIKHDEFYKFLELYFDVELLDRSEFEKRKVLTSNGIKKRTLPVFTKRGIDRAEKSGITESETISSGVFPGENDNNQGFSPGKSAQSRVEYSRVEKSTEKSTAEKSEVEKRKIENSNSNSDSRDDRQTTIDEYYTSKESVGSCEASGVVVNVNDADVDFNFDSNKSGDAIFLKQGPLSISFKKAKELIFQFGIEYSEIDFQWLLYGIAEQIEEKIRKGRPVHNLEKYIEKTIAQMRFEKTDEQFISRTRFKFDPSAFNYAKEKSGKSNYFKAESDGMTWPEPEHIYLDHDDNGKTDNKKTTESYLPTPEQHKLDSNKTISIEEAKQYYSYGADFFRLFKEKYEKKRDMEYKLENHIRTWWFYKIHLDVLNVGWDSMETRIDYFLQDDSMLEKCKYRYEYFAQHHAEFDPDVNRSNASIEFARQGKKERIASYKGQE